MESWYVFAGHSEHCEEWGASLYLPVWHVSQTHAYSGPVVYVPSSHRQSTMLVLPVPVVFDIAGHGLHAARPESAAILLYVCIGQGVQIPGLLPLLYLPAVHVVHDEAPSGPVYPGLHLQSLFWILPAAEFCVLWHASQATAAPTEYLPCRQVTQSLCSFDARIAFAVPGGHERQLVCNVLMLPCAYLPRTQEIHCDTLSAPVPSRYLPVYATE